MLFAPSFSCASSGPMRSQTRAKTNGFDTLITENSNAGVAHVVHVAADARDAEPEQVRRHALQGGVHRRVGPLAVAGEPRVRLFDEAPDGLRRG